MTRFVSISSFREALNALISIKRGVYAGVVSEICKAFQGVPIESIRCNRDMILMDSDSVVIKLRLPDKRQHLSKADGYRLIYLVMKNAPVVVLLNIYPKRGPLQKINLGVKELETLLDAVKQDFNNNQIVIHDIENNLEIISIH